MNMLGDEPPYLSVGTEVSAKYKGAFCEAKVRKVDRVVKCKVAFKLGIGSHTVLDNQIKGVLRVGSVVEVKHPEKKELVEATVTKIQDCSQYTVVFDDGDITTLRRSALCLKSGRHFAESETLDQLPLTHPEHFGNPVVGSRRGGRRRLGEESSGDEESPRKGRPKEEREAEIGKVVCVDLGDKKKVKDNWFPGLVVSPNAQDTVRIRVKEEYLVRSFKDGRYFTVPKKEATDFTREIGSKVDNNTLKTAVEKALTYLDKDELPPHWDRELLFGLLESEASDSEGALDSDSSDDEPREEKDHFVAQLYKFMDDRGTPINSCPSVCSRDLDLYKLFKVVHKMNGYNRVSNQNQWKIVSSKLGLGNSPGIVTQVKYAYKRFLHSFEDFYRKLGCTMVNHPRGGRSRNRGGRSLIRDKDRSTPVSLKAESASTPKPEEKGSTSEESQPIQETRRASIKEEDTKIVVKEETPVTPAPSTTTSEEIEIVRSVSSLRKKFPTLKASPRTKDEPPAPPVKKPTEVRPPSGRVKRPTRDNSLDEAKASDDETTRTPNRPPSARLKRAARDNSVDESRVSDDEPVRAPSRSVNVRPKRAARGTSVDDGRGSDDENPKVVKAEEQVQKSTTRSKSKEEMKVLVKKEPVETKRAKSSKSSDSEGSKKSKSSSTDETKKPMEVDKKGKKPVAEDMATKRNRKRGTTDSTADETKPRPCLPRTKSVLVGDILKVYYGSPNDPNGIYEAKVVDIEENEGGQQMFLVHYAGWNSRYDEWVSRNKIAENLSWTSRRAKASPLKNVKTTASKRKGPANKPESGRSTTPSSITSSSSRTKSPATPASLGNRRSTRRDQPPPGITTSRRTRRLSGHTDVSLDSASESESESVESDSEPEIKREKTTPDLPVAEEWKKETKKAEPKAPVKRKPAKKAADEPSSSAEIVEKKKPRLISTATPKVETDDEPLVELQKLKLELPTVVEIKTEVINEEPPKGRDFDLNEIRSELKGIDKAVKISTEPVAAVSESEVEEGEVFIIEYKPAEANNDSVDTKTEEVEVTFEKAEEVVVKFEPKVTDDVKSEVIVKEEVPPVVAVPEEKVPAPAEEKTTPPDIKDDIYEFKEPEPFEFQEVRRPIRIFDEIVERSPEKSIAVKKVNVSSSPMRATFEKREVLPLEADVKSRFRKTIGKKMKEVGAMEKKVTETEVKVEESAAIKEAPILEAEEPCPLPPILPDPEDISMDDDPPPAPHKLSPEPPCLIPVTETLPCQPPEQSPVLVREDPPRLDSDLSNSDSESEERLVIAHDDESTWSDTKPEPQTSASDERKEVKRSPLAEVRLKRIEERKSPPAPVIEKLIIAESDIIQKPGPILSTPAVLNDELEVEEKLEADDGECSMRSLVCDEVIPGSPAPKDPVEEMPFHPPTASSSNAAVVMDNTPPTTPPTTPESNISSPREDRVGSSSLDNESSKSHRESPEVEMDNDGIRNRSIKYGKRTEKEPEESPSKKKRRSRKRSESASETCKRGPGRGAATRAHKARDASDSDDTSENSVGIHPPDPLMNSRSPRPSKYNFCKELAPDLDANQRVAFLQNQIAEIRKAYMHLKSQLASIDRRRKKLRRKDREEKAEKAAAAAAAAAVAAAAAAVATSTCPKPQEVTNS